MTPDEIVGRELHRVAQESYLGIISGWEGMSEEERDHWIAEGARINKLLSDWTAEEDRKEAYRKEHEHDMCTPDKCYASAYLCHCPLGYRGSLPKYLGLPPAHAHK